MNWPAIVLIGAAVGFLGGLFGKGGSAVATPLLAAVGVPPMLAVAAPLPATIPGTLVAAQPYLRRKQFDREVLGWSLAVAVVTTIIGALATHWVNGSVLVEVTDVMVAGLGLRFLLKPLGTPDDAATQVPNRQARTIAVAALVGLAGGLLANSGGFLLAPLYLAVLRLPVKPAFGTSLIVSSVLAVPGTVVHAALGQIDWSLVLAFGLASVPLSAVGARVALRADARHLERVYGAVLAVLGIGLLVL